MSERKSPYEAPSCINNAGVVCLPETKHCDTCGWDPDVARVRLLKICEERGIALPDFLTAD